MMLFGAGRVNRIRTELAHDNPIAPPVHRFSPFELTD
jgi:hypothetical protein